MSFQKLLNKHIKTIIVISTILLAIIFVSLPNFIFTPEYSITCKNQTKYLFSNETHLLENIEICEFQKQMYLNNEDIKFTNGID